MQNSSNQKYYPDLAVTRHQYGISAVVLQRSFRGETVNVGCFFRLFSCQ